MRSDTLLRVAGRFERALFVGDPGQLDPFSTVEGDRWAGLSLGPDAERGRGAAAAQPRPAGAPAAGVVAAARLGGAGGRRRRSTRSPVPRRHRAAATGGWRSPPRGRATRLDAGAGGGGQRPAGRCYELPGPAHRCAPTRRRCAAVRRAGRCGCCSGARSPYSEQRRPARRSPPTGSRSAPRTATRSRRSARALGAAGAGITVDTANRLQGREYDVTIVLHPLSGRRDATAFHLESGRLCVLTSRHRHACVVVARAGIAELLDAHPSAEPVHLGVPVKFPDGWEANQAVLAHLARAPRLEDSCAVARRSVRILRRRVQIACRHTPARSDLAAPDVDGQDRPHARRLVQAERGGDVVGVHVQDRALAAAGGVRGEGAAQQELAEPCPRNSGSTASVAT